MTDYFELRDNIRFFNRVNRDLEDAIREAVQAETLEGQLSKAYDALLKGFSSGDTQDAEHAVATLLNTASKQGDAIRERIMAALAPHSEQLRAMGIDSMASDLVTKGKELHEAYEAEEERVRESLLQALVQRGWYLTWDLRGVDHDRMMELMAAGNPDSAETIIAEHVRRSVEDIRAQVKETFADRALIFDQAFDAHRAGLYALSIPTLLTQAEWMSRQAINASVFSKKGNAPATATKFDHITGQRTKQKEREHWDLESLLETVRLREFEPLRYLGSLHLDSATVEQQRDPESGIAPLSRHAILHGDDPTYPTEANSLRAILLVSFLTRAFNELQSGGSGETDRSGGN